MQLKLQIQAQEDRLTIANSECDNAQKQVTVHLAEISELKTKLHDFQQNTQLLEQVKGTITRLETELATKQSAVEAAEAA